MDRTTTALLGVAGIGMACSIGYGIYQVKKSSSVPNSNNTNLTNTNLTTSNNRSWKTNYPTHYVQNDRVLFNVLDALSVYGHVDEQIFLDIVHFTEQFCIIYYLSQQHTKNNTVLLEDSSKIQIQLFNAIGELEKVVSQKYVPEHRRKKMDDFKERSQLLIEIINGYHINIIREMNVT